MGLACILAAFALVSPTVDVPMPGSLGAWPAAVVVLLAGTGEEPRGAWLLANPVAGYLGDLSYGLYLWHFPIAVIGAAWHDRDTPTYAAVALGLTLALASITHHLVERPILDGRLRPRPMIASAAALFMTETYNWSLKLNSGATGAARAAEWADADQAFVDAIAPSGTQVVIVSPSIDGVAYYDCDRQGGSPQRCTAGVPSWWRPIQDAERHIRGATFLDTLHWYCVDGRCPMISTASGHTLMKVDYIHQTYAYDRLVAGDLAWRVAALGVTP